MYFDFSVLGLIFLTFTLPETKGRDLEEIEGIFAKSWIVPDTKLPSILKRDSSPFSYVHINGGSTSNLAEAQSSSAETGRTSRTSPLGESVAAVNDDTIDTKLCTNRQLSTTDEGEDNDDDSDEDSLS